jgi:hypothetical protein
MTEAQAHDYVARLKHDWQLRKALTESEVIKKARNTCTQMAGVGSVLIIWRLRVPVASRLDWAALIFVTGLTIIFPAWKLVRLAQAHRALGQSSAGSSRLSSTK